MNTPVSFEIAKLLKEKGFDEPTQRFYPKPKCKLFGKDEHGRHYPIVNKTQTYFIGEAVVLKEENALKAPIITEVVMWFYDKHGIWIYASDNSARLGFMYQIQRLKILGENNFSSDVKFGTPTEAYEAAISYTLKNLI